MNTKPIDAIANAVLYEGYMLYPYRPSSVKNRQRFNFGVLYPKSYSEKTGSDPWSLQTELLVEGSARTALQVSVRFLKLVDRSAQKLSEPAPEFFGNVAVLELGHKASPDWQEAVECDVAVSPSDLGALEAAPLPWAFAFPGKADLDHRRDADGRQLATIVRKQESLFGVVEVGAMRVADGVFKVQVTVKNLTPFEDAAREDLATHNGRDP